MLMPVNLVFIHVKMFKYLNILPFLMKTYSSRFGILLSAFAKIQVVEKSLAEVRLTQSAKMRAGSYSGGMKRRLSVAIALIGDPKLVILDEPVCGFHFFPLLFFISLLE